VPTYNSNPSLIRERIRKTKNEADFVALKASVLRAEHVNRKALEVALREIMLAIKQIIEASMLTDGEKREILQNLSQIPVTVDQVRKDQTKAVLAVEAAEGNGHSDDGEDENGPEKVLAKKARRTGTKAGIRP
jgi:hypothetical protein